MTKISKKWRYYIPGLTLVVVGTIILWEISWLNFLVGSTIFISGCYFCFLGYQIEIKDESFDFDRNQETSYSGRTVYTAGGTYNENIQGDYFVIQGSHVHINQDLSSFISQIHAILVDLQNQGLSQQAAEQKVKDDLKTQAFENALLQEKLYELENLTSASPNDFSKDELEVLKIINSANKNSFNQKSSQSVGQPYEKLYRLLKSQKWEEADQETALIILKSLPKEEYTYYFDVVEISPIVLRKIDYLWVNFSGGRFGFSIQQQIWRKISMPYTSKYNLGFNEAYFNFIDEVGWPREENRIYYVDIEYSLDAPKGHLPALTMFIPNYLDFDDKSNYSNYCHLNKTTFDNLMKREYKNFSLIGAWLKRWLLHQ